MEKVGKDIDAFGREILHSGESYKIELQIYDYIHVVSAKPTTLRCIVQTEISNHNNYC